MKVKDMFPHFDIDDHKYANKKKKKKKKKQIEMSTIIRNKHKFYKKTLIDLWGHHFTYYKASKAVNFMRIMKSEGKARH